jgi:predicted acetyltransferase
LAIANDPVAFLASLDDPEALGADIQLADGSFVKRLPSFRRWIWADGFCGSIGLRWQNGTNALPPTCSGHIGYSVVPWRRLEGLATEALRAILPEARRVGLSVVDLTVDPENPGSVRVIEKNGGQLVTCRDKASKLGGEELVYQIEI